MENNFLEALEKFGKAISGAAEWFFKWEGGGGKGAKGNERMSFNSRENFLHRVNNQPEVQLG